VFGLESECGTSETTEVIGALNMFGVYDCAVCSENEAWTAGPRRVRYFEWPEAGLFADG